MLPRRVLMYEFLCTVSSFLDTYLGMELLVHFYNFVFYILKNCLHFTKWLTHFTFLPNNIRGPQFSIQLLALVIIFYYSHLSCSCKVVSHCYFDWLFFFWMTNHTEHFLCVLFGHLYVFFREMFIHVLCRFCNWIACFLVVEL